MTDRFKVLYAEDNPIDADLTRAHLAEHAPHFDLAVAESGQQCLSRLSAEPWDLLLLDHHLPDMEGLDVLRAMVRSGVTVPVVLVTGAGDEDLVVTALHLGASSYVPKVGAYLETLPGVMTEVVEEHRVKRSRGLLAQAQRRILYVEHQAMDIELTERHFAEAAPHVELHPARSCGEALDRLARGPAFDAVLIDLRMPDQSGLEFVREAKRRGLRLPPFVMISGKGDEEAAIASLRLGAADYIAKRDGYLDQLPSTIDRAIAHARLNELNAQLQTELAERLKAEAALRFQKLLLESQNEASIDGILNVDADGRIVWHNRRFSELWGVADGAMPATFEELARESMLPKLADPGAFSGTILALNARPDAKTRDELRLTDGRIFDRYSGPMADDAGRYLGRVWLFRDLTDQKQLQASAAQSDRLASMGLLAAGVAHEINNPLSYILYNLESLSEDLPRYAAQVADARRALADRLGEAGLREALGGSVEFLDASAFEDAQERFRDALEGTQRIKDIARGLRTFSRVEQESIGPVDLVYSIRSAVSIAFNEIKYRARIVEDLQPTAPVLASDGRLSQVFLNLLINAAHAIAEGDVEHNQIIVRTRQQGGEVTAEVEDTGCGIPPENLPRIFDPFFTTKPAGIGSGLGLNIVKNILTGYRGTIEVTSRVGAGTHFLIRLPAAAEDAALPDRTAAEAQRATGEIGRVLVIDDEPAIRAMLRRILRPHEVVEAESGEQGQRVLSTDQRFDVILCDMMMPKVSGIDVHRWLRATYPPLARKVVFVTGGAFTPTAGAYLEQVDNLRLEKPFDPRNLQKMVAEWVSASRRRG